MGFESVKEFKNLFQFAERKFGDESQSQTLEGKFIKTFQYQPKDQTKDELTVHVIEVADGSVREVFGSGGLNHLLAKVEPGKLIQIVYEGLEEGVDKKISQTEKLHHFDVLVDDGKEVSKE